MTGEFPASCDVAIVGGGPAGLAAATELRAAGVASVVVLEREANAGGIPRHCGHYPFGMREFRGLMRGPDYAARLVGRAVAAGVSILTDATVTALSAGPVLSLATPDGPRSLAARRVMLATGVREKSRAARMIGGTKPGGVLSTGALQGLVYLNGTRPFLRPVILGTELVSFSALLTCRHLGIRPVAMVEAGSRTTARWPAALAPRVLGVPLLLETELVSIRGDRSVEEVVVRDRAGNVRSISADGVVVSGQFLPESALLQASHLELDPHSGGPMIDQFGRCSDPDYFAAGNLLRAVETAGWSWAEGRRTGRAIARSLAGGLPAPGPAVNVKPQGTLIKYVLPQRIAPAGPADLATARFQLRLNRAARGRLCLRANGAEIWSTPLDSLPERRITVPLSVVPRDIAGNTEFSIVEDAT